MENLDAAESISDQPEGIVAETKTQVGKNKMFTVVGLALLVIGAIFSLLIWRKSVSHDQSQKAVVEKSPATVSATPTTDLAIASEQELAQISVDPVEERTIDVAQETTGKVAFNEDRQTPVFTPYAGRVVELLANKGDLVHQGQPLLVVESPDLVAAVNDLSAARADQDKAKIALDAAQKIADRSRSLFEKEALAAKDLQQAESDLARSREELRRAQAAVAVAENKLALFGKDEREIEHLELQTVNSLDRRVVIRAPIRGTVVERKVGNGQFIKTDTPDPLYLISDLSTLWVMADVYESLLPNIRVGSPVEISVPSVPNRTFPARISFINPTVDAATRTVHVRCVVPNAMGAGSGWLLKPDMFAKIKIGAAVKQSKPVVPTGAIISENNTTMLYVEEGHGRFRRREVKSGGELQGVTVVESGVKPGERVVTHGVLLLNGIVGKPSETRTE